MINKLESWILSISESQIMKRTMVWNMISSILSGFFTAIIVFFITRISGIEVAGIINLAAAYGYQCLTLGSFGVRNVQASDVNYENSFSDYFYQRIITSCLMYFLLIYYSFMSGYALEKALIIFLFGVFKSIDAIEDLYHGEYQRHNRLDIGSILLSFRLFISLVVMVITLFLSKDIILTLFVTCVVSMIIFIIQNKNLIKKFDYGQALKFNKGNVLNLFKITLPLCLSYFISMYLTNSPKYAIDQANLGESIQGVFGILMMPVFTINLISNMIFRPLVNNLSVYWNKNNLRKFIKNVCKQIILVAIITFSIMIFGYIIGLYLLQIIYGTELMSYMSSFMILLFGGGVITLSNVFLLLLTIQREQNKVIFVYIIGLFLTILFAQKIVVHCGIIGASWLYVLINLFMFIAFFGIFCISIYKKHVIIRKED